MFELMTPYEKTQRWDRPWSAGSGDVAGHNPLNPNDARFYDMGEWLQYDTAYTFQRGGDAGDADGANEADCTAAQRGQCWPFFLERGRYDMQGIAGGRATVLYGGFYEFVTDVCDYAGIAALTIGAPLTVASFTIAGVVRRALVPIVGAGIVHARLTFVDTTNSRIRATRVYS